MYEKVTQGLIVATEIILGELDETEMATLQLTAALGNKGHSRLSGWNKFAPLFDANGDMHDSIKGIVLGYKVAAPSKRTRKHASSGPKLTLKPKKELEAKAAKKAAKRAARPSVTKVAPQKRYRRLNNTVKVDVIDQEGNFVEEREFHNVGAAVLCPKEKFVLIDWMAADGKKPTIEELETPIEYKGTLYHGAYMWGSSVKRGITLGAENDLVKLWEHDFNEDAMRFMRLLFGEGIFGGIEATEDKPLRVLIVKPGTMVNGRHPVEDGFGYIRRSVAMAGANEDMKRIVLDGSRDSAQFTQRLPAWVFETALPSIKANIAALSEPGSRGMSTITQLHEKQQWVQLEPDMVKHPYVANALDNASADSFARGAMALPVNARSRVAIPSIVKKIASAVDLVAFRYPIDAWNSIAAVKADGSPEELKRIFEMEVSQFTLANQGFYASGCLGVLDDVLMPDGIDIIICADNIKLRKGNPSRRKKTGTMDFEGVLMFHQWFDKGSAIGIGYKWYSSVQGGDFDGDLETIFTADDVGQDLFDVLFQAILEFPTQGSPKMFKSKIRLSEGGRAKFAFNSMVNLVGFASNLQASTFSVTDRKGLAEGIGFASVGEMDDYFRRVMALAVDGYKSSKVYIERKGEKVLVTIPQTEKNLGRIQTKIVGFLGGLAPWNGWNGDGYWFKHQVPWVIEKTLGKGKYKVAGKKKSVWLSKDERKGSVRPTHDTLIAKIARYALPALANCLGTTVSVRPLSYFKAWAPEVTEEEEALAAEYVDWHNYHAPRVSWSDGDDVRSFKNRCQIRFNNFCKAHPEMEREIALAAIWHKAHSSQSKFNRAGAPFLADPDLAAEFVTDKPGMKSGEFSATLVGLHYQMARKFRAWKGEVEVVERVVVKNRKKVYRLFIKPVDANGLSFAPKKAGDQYPEGFFGMLSGQSPGVKEGTYVAEIKVTSARSASITLTR